MKVFELKPAEYNPRLITDEKLNMLKESIEEFGDLSGVVFNRLTGNLVGGHQRLKCMSADSKIHKKDLKEKTKTGTVAEGSILVNGETWKYREVEWDLRREKKANLAANKHGGDWDEIKLKEVMNELAKEGVNDLEITGFDKLEIESLILDENSKLHCEEELEEKTVKLKEYKKTHILISFNPDIFSSVKKHIEEISKIEGVEIEQSSN